MLNEKRPNEKRRAARICVDRGAFMECYARIMMRFTKLTLHQCAQLEAIQHAPVSVLVAPAGGGKTFVAVKRMLDVVRNDQDLLFVAPNKALALFACKWLVVSSGKSAECVVHRVHVLVPPFERGPRGLVVETGGGRQRLVIDEADIATARYELVVVDEVHTSWRRCARAGETRACTPLVLADAAGYGDSRHGDHRALARGTATGARRRRGDALEVVRRRSVLSRRRSLQLEAGHKARLIRIRRRRDHRRGADFYTSRRRMPASWRAEVVSLSSGASSRIWRTWTTVSLSFAPMIRSCRCSETR